MHNLTLPAELYIHEKLTDGTTMHCCTMRQQILHCIGMIDSGSQRHKPYKRHGRTFFKPWRNYFTCAKRSTGWEKLVEYGYAERGRETEGSVPYYMTRKGLDWLGKQLGMTIYDESE